MRYYFCIYKDNSISNIKRNLTSKQLKYAIRDYAYRLNNGRINKCDIQLLSSSLIYDIRNDRAHRKYNIFKIFTNEDKFNDFLKENGIKIKDSNKVKLSNIIMKYEPTNKTKLSDIYDKNYDKNYDKKLSYDDNDENIYFFIGEGNKNNKINKKQLSKLLD